VRITGIELGRYAFPLDPPFECAWDPIPRDRSEVTIVRVQTDEGIVGIGSGDTMDGFGRFEHLFLGEDPLELERHVSVLETMAFHGGRYWPLEAALWDLAGKAQGQSVADLLAESGNRSQPRQQRVPVYASSGARMAREERVEAALARREEGFAGLKLRVEASRMAEDLETVAAVRDAVGDGLDLMVDLNQGWRMPGDVSPPLQRDAVRTVADELDALGVLWLEEPLPTHDVDGLFELRTAIEIRIAGGEMVRAVWELERCLEAGALDVYQPDGVLAVGLKRAAELAGRVHAEGLWFTPHTWTNGIGLLANLHVSAAVGARPFVEFPHDPPGWTPERRDWMLAEPLRVGPDGCVPLSDSPGLGIELDEERLEAHRIP
jgi:L-alanine-DL-glutamate epimerase-like enolase superfamily enzyme